jgi:PAS domain S-box-containing protein
MSRDRDQLLAALCRQTGLITSSQYAEACRLCEDRPDEPLEEVLIERGWIQPADRPHLEYLRHRLLRQYGGDAKASLTHLPGIDPTSLEVLEGLEPGRTDGGATHVPAAGGARASEGAPPVAPRYAFTRLHAMGGMGRVWLAHDVALGRDVAVKDLRPEAARDARTAERFVREARLTGQLEHPGIVPVYELMAPADSEKPFYAMRFVRGRTLTSAIEAFHARRRAGEKEPPELATLLTAFAAVCNTVAYAHSRGVLHRDLKPDNVMLGDFGEVVVLDWGLAKILDQADRESADAVRLPADLADDPSLTIQGEVIGTPAYMAPEQAAGRLELVSERTDVYGLGAMLYEILTGQPPFVGSNTLDVIQKAVRGNPPPPDEIWPDVPPALEQICQKAMAKVPGMRYARAEQLAQDVQRWQDTERRRAEDALRRQTEILGSILTNMGEGVLVSDEAGNVLHINPAAERLVGHVQEATRSSTRFYRSDRVTHFAPEDLPSARAIRGEEVNDLEMFVRRSLRTEGVWVSANARPLRDETGKLRGGVVVFRDVTERKRAEEELLRSRERFELAVRGSQDGLWDWDVRTGDVYYSPRWKSILGYEDNEIAHRIEEWEQRLHPEERERVLAANRACVEGTTPHYEYEYRLRHKDGSYRWILARGVALRDAAGKAYRMAGSHVDVTERRRADEERDRLLHHEQEARSHAEGMVQSLEETRAALRASEELHRSLADLLPGVVWTAAADGAIEYANKFWSDFTGMSLEQTRGSGWLAAVHPEDVERVTRIWTQALESGTSVEVDYRLRRADGVYRRFLARGRTVRDREGRVVRWFGLLTELDATT